MEYILDVLYQAVAVLLLCIAVSLLIWLFGNLNQMETKAKDNLYDSHVLYSSQI